MNKLLKKINKRLRSKKGESLVEVLASITIGLFASLSLLIAITTAAKVDRQSREIMNEYYNTNNAIELAMSGKTVAGTTDNVLCESGNTVTITCRNGGGYDFCKEYTVDFYINNTTASGSKAVVMYRLPDSSQDADEDVQDPSNKG